MKSFYHLLPNVYFEKNFIRGRLVTGCGTAPSLDPFSRYDSTMGGLSGVIGSFITMAIPTYLALRHRPAADIETYCKQHPRNRPTRRITRAQEISKYFVSHIPDYLHLSTPDNDSSTSIRISLVCVDVLEKIVALRGDITYSYLLIFFRRDCRKKVIKYYLKFKFEIII